MRIEADRGEGELGHVGLADDHGTGSAQSLDDEGIFLGRDRIAADDGAGKRRFARNVEQVLDRNDLAVERTKARAVPSASVGGIGFRAGIFRTEAYEGFFFAPAIVEPAQDLFQAVAGGSVGEVRHDDDLSIWCRGAAA